MADQFRKVSKALENAVATATRKALSRAATSARTVYAKEISKDLGVSSATAKRRAKTIVGDKKTPAAILSVGTKIDLAAHEFKTGKKKVMSSRGRRIGATYRIQGKTLMAPRGILVKGKYSGKDVIVSRIKNRPKDYSFKTVRVSGLVDAVKNKTNDIHRAMKDSFKKNFNSFLSFEFNKKK